MSDDLLLDIEIYLGFRDLFITMATSVVVYGICCIFGNVRENLCFANFRELVASQMQCSVKHLF